MKVKKIISRLIVMILIITSTSKTTQHVMGEEKTHVIYEKDNIIVTFQVSNQWNTGFEGQFIIQNNGTVPLENWFFQCDFSHEILSLWDGEIESHTGNQYVIKYPNWKRSIEPGATQRIGFTGEKDGEIKSPTNVKFLGTTSTVTDSDVLFTYHTLSDWSSAFNGEIRIKNQTSKKIENWSLEFDFDKEITNFWTAKLVEQKGNHYKIKHAEWNSVIRPGETIQLGFEGRTGNVTTEPMNFKLIESTINTADKETEEELDEIDLSFLDDLDFETDTDGDGLPDGFEQVYETDPENPDTDQDGLSDFIEIMELGTDPLKADSDDNGLSDALEDFDKDGLWNKQELNLGTNPLSEDSDGDGLLDGEEVNRYKTDPLKEDTDEDGVSDGDEILLNLNPLEKDTDGNGILDCDEKIMQVYSATLEQEDRPEVKGISVAFAASGNIQKTTKIENMYDIDIHSSEVIGLIGVPIEITTESSFEEANISFSYDEKQLPEGTKQENLAIMWYNEKEGIYEIQESKVDKVNQTVTTNVSHFSTYLLVDKEQWNKVWAEDLNYGSDKLAVGACDIVYVIDASLSMSNAELKEVKKGGAAFIESLGSKDRVAVIRYNSTTSKMVADFSNSKEEVIEGLNSVKNSNVKTLSSGTTTIGLKDAVAHIKENSSKNGKYVVIFGDDDMKLEEDLLQSIVSQGIKLFVVNIADRNKVTNLRSMIVEAGGYYYTANKSKNIENSLYHAYEIIRTGVNTKDSDGDGLFDVFEKKGIRSTNGQLIKTDPKNADSDNDELTDFEELDGSNIVAVTEITNSKVRAVKSNKKSLTSKEKSKPKMKDSDKDGIPDANDPTPKKAHDQMFYVSDIEMYSPPTNKVVEANRVISDGNYGKNPKPDRKKLKNIYIRAQATAKTGKIVFKNAGKFLTHFLDDTGETLYFDIKDFLQTKNGNRHYFSNVDDFLQTCEDMVMDNDTILIRTKSNYNRISKACTLSSKSIRFDFNKENDWLFAIGDADASMVGKCSRKGNKYTLNLYYYVQDYYDWEETATKKGGGIVKDSEMYQLHYAGMARSYKVSSRFINVISWEKGQRFSNGNDSPGSSELSKK